MQRLSTDTRPEVRNSGVRTLYSVVVSHGSKLSDAQWRQCFWGILFPLLRTVHHMSVTSSREEASPSRTGAQTVPGASYLHVWQQQGVHAEQWLRACRPQQRCWASFEVRA
jgi:hypothetical protein